MALRVVGAGCVACGAHDLRSGQGLDPADGCFQWSMLRDVRRSTYGPSLSAQRSALRVRVRVRVRIRVRIRVGVVMVVVAGVSVVVVVVAGMSVTVG